jgi:superfamily II DNA or RNA helicase
MEVSGGWASRAVTKPRRDKEDLRRRTREEKISLFRTLFDDPRLDTLSLALPIAWKGTLVQYAGRLHRRHHGKTEVRIYDYVDEAVLVLDRIFEGRQKGYQAMGYEVDDSAPSPRLAGREYVVEYEDPGHSSQDPRPF